LTSFSIMLARFKGDFENYLRGTPKISQLKDGDRILLLESCTHHVSCDDIGRTKIPRWISRFTGKKIEYEVVAGLDQLPRPVTEYALVIQCGGCMITRKQLHNRLHAAIKAGIPVTNYGMAIAYTQGIYNRAVAPFLKGKKEDDIYL
jgi:predicted GTPase